MRVLFIVFLHAVPVFVVAVLTKSKVALTIAAIIVGIIGAATGNPAYMAGDLIGVCIAFWVGISFINNQKPYVPPQAEKPQPAPEKKDDDSSWVGGIVGLIIVGTFLYHKAVDKPEPSPPVVQAPQQAAVASKAQASPTERQTSPGKMSTPNNSKANQDIRHCLNLSTHTAIMRCTNQGK